MSKTNAASMADALLNATVDLQKTLGAGAPLVPELLECMSGVWTAAHNLRRPCGTEELRQAADAYGFFLRLLAREPNSPTPLIDELAARLRELESFATVYADNITGGNQNE